MRFEFQFERAAPAQVGVTVQVANVELSLEFKFFGAYAEAGCSVGGVV